MAGLMWVSSRVARASFLAARAAREESAVDVNKAIALNSMDADAYLLRGAMLEASNDLPAAAREYERATALRPQDYVLWLMFARGCELNGERGKAIAAARMAVPLAPFYAQPHWQLGNLLVRDGQTAEGFKELRLASSINQEFLSPVIDLAWQLSQGDVQFVKDTIRPERPVDFAALAEYFKRRGRIDEAVEMFAAAGNDPQFAQRRQQVVGELISAKKFKEAYRLWNNGKASSQPSDAGVLIDGGFEQGNNLLLEPGFGWRADNRAASITRAFDSTSVKAGRSSLRIEFIGDSDQNVPVISQFVLVEPGKRYRVQFAARAENIVSGGLPTLRVIDATNGAVLGEDSTLSQSRDWRDYSIQFSTGESTSAIQIVLLRKPCETSPCPIFGRLWLDALSLQK
jgi:hypothetical protein